MLLDAIKISIPTFSVKNISDYYLSKQDQKILNRLAISYSEENQPDKAVEIMYELKHNYDKHCIDSEEMGLYYPAIIYSLARFLGEADRLEESLEICDIGFNVCKETRSLYRLPFILCLKAANLGWLGRKDESMKLFAQIVNMMELYEMHDDIIAVKRQMKEVLGVDM